jgi:hypothetical protein
MGSSDFGASREDSIVKYGGSDTMTTDIIIAAVFFIVGLIPAYYFYVKSIRIKEPVYSIRSGNLISDDTSDFPDLVVSYRGQQVKNFTFSTVLFFNRGALTIDRTDIASLNPLRIVPKDCNILDASVFIYNNPSNGITLTADEERGGFRIDFEYLNQGDGAILTILHDGVSSENLYVIGDMKEARSIRRVAPGWMRVIAPPSTVNLVVGAATVFLAVTSAVGLLLPLSEQARGWFWGGVLYFSALAGLSLLSGIVYLVSRARSVVVPKGLEIFDE